MPQHFDECEPSPDAARHAKWLLKKAGVKTNGIEPPEPLGMQNVDADYRAVADANRDKIKEARLDMHQHEIEQLWAAITERCETDTHLATQILKLTQIVVENQDARIARLESQIAHLSWMTHDIDPIEESYKNNWLPKPSWLHRLIAGWGK